jgi:hexosaminidase
MEGDIMKDKAVVVVIVSLIFAFVVRAPAMEELKLVPMPQEINLLEGKTRLSLDWVISLPNSNPDDDYAAELLASEIQQCFGWGVKTIDQELQHNCILLKGYSLKGGEPELFKEQGYVMSIEPSRIVIEAPSAVGRFYGVQTLRQLLRTAKDGEIPRLTITDYPALQWRGISDDVSRGQVSTVEDFKEIIRQLAFYKKNLYQPYIEDMFAFDTDPNIGKDRGAITKAEMAQMVEEARKNHIVLTPVFECLGHQDRLLSLPENRRYAELQDPAKRPWSFSPVLPEALAFLKKLIAEMAEATPSPFFHIGGDESFDVGDGTSKKMVRKRGAGRVHAEFFARLRDYLKEAFNRQMMLYADMLLRHPEALSYLPKDVILVDWHYMPEADYPSVKKLKDAGFKYIMASPGLWSWATFYPYYRIGFKNIAVFTEVAKRENVMGCITSSWGDDGAENLRENNWLGYAFSAAAEWERAMPDADAFRRRFVAVHYGADSDELADVEKCLGWIDDLGDSYTARIFHHTMRVEMLRQDRLAKMQTLEEDMKNARDLLARSRGIVKFNASHLDSIDLAARRYVYMANRFKTLDSIARTLGDKQSGDLSTKQQHEIVSQLESLRNELVDITMQFECLWLRRNKFPKLDFNLERLQRQVSELQNLISLTLAGNLSVQPVPESVWFWYPEEEPTKETKEGTRHFLRVFDLNEAPRSAQLKCWADDKATVLLNGKKVFEVTYYDAPVTKHVGRFLRKGKNYLALEGYNAIGAAGILLELTVSFSDGTTMRITGDKQWRAAQRVKGGWATAEPKGRKWQQVKLLGKGLIKPWDSIDW